MAVFHILATALPGYLRLGPWQVPAFGLIATMGLVLALFISQRTARLAGLDPDRLWDAGIVAVLSAFVASRILLIAANPHTFLRQPLLVLAQPSLTVAGLALATLITWFWLRRHGLPLRQVGDAWAIPGLLLAAALQVAHFAEGTELGMPTALPWGVLPRGGHSIRLHPVQLYAAAAYLVMAGILLWHLRQRNSRSSGAMAALALMSGGFVAFLAGFLRIPYELDGHGWLDPGQWTGLVAVLAGASWWLLPKATVPVVQFQEAH